MSESSSDTVESSGNRLPRPIMKHSRSLGVVVALSALVFATVVALSVLTTIVIVLLQPRMYESSVLIKVEPEQLRIAVFQSVQVEFDPYFQRTQFEIIQSQKILHQVIEQLSLQERWARSGRKLPLKVAYDKLRSQLIVRCYRDTALIEIVVRSTRPAEAAEIANTIAKIFQADRLQSKRHQVERGLDALHKEIDSEAQRVATARQKVEQLRLQLNIPASVVAQPNDETESAYGIAQRELRLEQHLYEVAKIRVQQATDELQAPKSPVEIITPAVTGRASFTLDTVRGVRRGVFIGLPLAIVFSLLTALRLYRK